MTNDRMLDTKTSRFVFPSRQFLTELSYQMSNDMEIISMSPDTLFFGFGQLSQKRIKIKPKVNVDLKKQYQISGDIKTVPAEILVNGPRKMLDTIQFIYTRLKSYNAVDKTIQENIEIERVKELYFDRQSVDLTIPVEEYTEADQTVPVTLTDAPANIQIKLFPARVKISYLVSLSRFSEIHPEDFKLSVSYPDIEKGAQRLTVKANTVPSYLYDVKVSPEEIEYLIEN
jgi:YbbR domain-containing protein